MLDIRLAIPLGLPATGSPPGAPALLMEDGSYLLLEDGSHILLE